jgi:hypothetical protein
MLTTFGDATTPEAFKTCLMRSRKYPNQTIDPVVYCDYYLLLEKT